MKRNLYLITLLLFVVGLAFSQRHEKPRHEAMKKGKMERMMHHKKMKGNFLEHLPEITDEQKKQVKEINTSFMKSVLPIKNEMKEKRAHLETLATKEKPDRNKLDETIEDIGKLQIKLKKLEMNKRQEIRALLTEEQRIIFDTHKMKRKMKKHRL